MEAKTIERHARQFAFKYHTVFQSGRIQPEQIERDIQAECEDNQLCGAAAPEAAQIAAQAMALLQNPALNSFAFVEGRLASEEGEKTNVA